MAAESGSGDARDDAVSSAMQSLKRLGGMKRSYNLEVKLMQDPASKVRIVYVQAASLTRE